MTHALPESFDPFATHPFTNTSGIIPPPPLPSQYPIPIPQPRNQPGYPLTLSPSPDSHASPSSAHSSPDNSSSVTIPQARRHAPMSPPNPPLSQPIFVPFRQETSSPDLVLKKKPSSRKQLLSTSR